MRSRLFWGRLGTLIQLEGAYPKVMESFYRAVVQAIILYGSETWVILASMEKKIEGTHTEFLKIITVKRSKRLGDGTWEIPRIESIQEAAGTRSDRIYIERRQATVAQ